MNDDLKATLQRILKMAEDKSLVDEMRGSVTYKAPCPQCDDTGWQMVTSGRFTTIGGNDVDASVAVPVARRCPSGHMPPMARNKTTRKPTAAARRDYGGD